MDESQLNPNVGLEPEKAPAPAEPTPPPASTSSRLLQIGILAAAAALAFVWIKQDSDNSAARAKATSGTSQSKAADGPSPIKIGAPAPKLVLKDLQGRTVNLEDLKGKVVMVDFWATWCEPCQIMIPWLVEFHNRYASAGLEIVGVAMDDDGIKSVKPFAEEAKMNYPILLGDDATADNWGGVFGLPTSFLIDRQGKIRATHQGLIGKDVIEKDIRGLL